MSYAISVLSLNSLQHRKYLQISFSTDITNATLLFFNVRLNLTHTFLPDFRNPCGIPPCLKAGRLPQCKPWQQNRICSCTVTCRQDFLDIRSTENLPYGTAATSRFTAIMSQQWVVYHRFLENASSFLLFLEIF